MTFLSHLTWRRAVKNFDTSKPVSDEHVDQILESIHMTPTSFGLQPYRIQVITDPDLKSQIQEISWNQPQVTTCSHLLVLHADTDVEKRISAYITHAAEVQGVSVEDLADYEAMMRGFMERMNEEQLLAWAQRQVYIALGFAMAACAELEIDSCPMEGFMPAKLDELLELPSTLKSTVMLPIGYRDGEVGRAQVRFEEGDLMI